MQRGQLIAAVVVVVVFGALIAARLSGDDAPTAVGAITDTDTGTEAEREPGASTPSAAGTEAGDEVGPAASDTSQTEAGSTEAGSTEAGADAPQRLGPAGTLVGLDGWLQTDRADFDDFEGQVRIVQFWTFGCHNCKATIPHLQAIYERWHPEGLEIIGVHAPEFDHEKDPDAIAVAAVDHGVTWPIALDTNKVNFRAWQPGRRFWPRTFVIDQQGEIRFDHIGEGRYDELAATVSYLVENGP